MIAYFTWSMLHWFLDYICIITLFSDRYVCSDGLLYFHDLVFKIECDFERDTFCGYEIISNTYGKKWRRVGGNWYQIPPFDHTKQDVSGKWLLITFVITICMCPQYITSSAGLKNLIFNSGGGLNTCILLFIIPWIFTIADNSYLLILPIL